MTIALHIAGILLLGAALFLLCYSVMNQGKPFWQGYLYAFAHPIKTARILWRKG